MKKSLISVVLLSSILVGCTDSEPEVVKAVGLELPKAFIEVSEDTIKYSNYDYSSHVKTLKHVETGCLWSLSIVNTDGIDMEQIMIEKDGVSVPYCIRE